MRGYGQDKRVFWVAGVAVSSVVGSIGAWLFDARPAISAAIALVALSSLGYLLLRGFVLVREMVRSETGWARYLAPIHIVAHLIPMLYLVAAYNDSATSERNLTFLAPLLLFFYTGMRLWKLLYARFGTQLYAFFIFGNRGMLTAVVVLSVVGLLFPRSVGPAVFERVFLIYFAIHFLLTGPSVMIMSADYGERTSSGDSSA